MATDLQTIIEKVVSENLLNDEQPSLVSERQKDVVMISDYSPAGPL